MMDGGSGPLCIAKSEIIQSALFLEIFKGKIEQSAFSSTLDIGVKLYYGIILGRIRYLAGK